MERLLKVATPLTALTVVVPESVPDEGFVPMATAIDAEEEVTTLPAESSTATFTAGVTETPATVFVGCWVNASFVAVWALKVTVRSPLPVNVPVQGFVVPGVVVVAQVVVTRFGLLQLTKVDPVAGVALNVIVAPLTFVVMFGEHVLVTVCDEAGVPVPPHEVGASIVPLFGVRVTEPEPVPAKCSCQFRAAM